MADLRLWLYSEKLTQYCKTSESDTKNKNFWVHFLGCQILQRKRPAWIYFCAACGIEIGIVRPLLTGSWSLTIFDSSLYQRAKKQGRLNSWWKQYLVSSSKQSSMIRLHIRSDTSYMHPDKPWMSPPCLGCKLLAVLGWCASSQSWGVLPSWAASGWQGLLAPKPGVYFYFLAELLFHHRVMELGIQDFSGHGKNNYAFIPEVRYFHQASNIVSLSNSYFQADSEYGGV